ncbi:MAG: hypothetical protein CMN77_15260 [Spirochaetaceae bacterium]|nr:hypothetical protein [Spirochaetaceae bacterium]
MPANGIELDEKKASSRNLFDRKGDINRFRFMRKHRFLAVVAILAICSATYCKSGDEEPSDDQELLNLLDVNVANGIFWVGKTSQNSCNAGDAGTTATVCFTQTTLENTYLSGQSTNINLYLPSGNPPAGAVSLLVPHPDNSSLNTFDIAVSGDLSGGYETGNGVSRVLTLTAATSTTAANSSAQIQMVSFRAQQTEKTVEGTVVIRFLRASSGNPTYDVEYSFSMDRQY